MIKTIKFIDSDASRLYVTGCTHLGHKQPFIWQKRGYASSEEHTKGVIDKINNTCRAKDKLLVLGDFCLNTDREQFLDQISKINCELWFIRGNHNNSWEKMYLEHCEEKFGYEVIGYKWLNKIVYFGDYLALKWNNQICVCNHYPYWVFDGISKGFWSLTSHSHGTCELTLPSDLRMKQLDCGWDVHARPLSFSEIKMIMDSKAIAKNDHHDSQTSTSLN